jgi:DNA-binding MarR family transcriptional regulator
MGINMPEMGMVDSKNRVSEAAALYERANLADALFSRTQQRVLACVFGQLDRSYSVTELIAATGAGSGAVQRELARLAGSGILLRRKSRQPEALSRESSIAGAR